MKFIYKWIPRLYMLSTFFWAIGYLIWKYSKKVVIDETVNTMPIPILVVLVMLILIVTVGGAIMLLLTWWEKIKQDKLSFYTLAPIAILMLGTIVLGKLGIGKVYAIIEISVERFMQDLMTYNGSLNVLLWILGSGLVVGAIGLAWEYINAQQQTP